ncbi:MAG: hypothetical protein JWM88_1006 [Verrucomicrobia bacterium]|nr:hypothetical protein [Verrucomicrobiota bacterium]
MTYSLLHLNWLAVIVTTVVGFLLGWLWYSPLLFGNVWKAEMKVTDEKMKEIAQKGMARFFLLGLLYTLISTIALAVLIRAHIPVTWSKGARYGAFIGAVIVGARMLNAGVWEMRTLKLQAIKVGHEIVLFALQGAILTVWW